MNRPYQLLNAPMLKTISIVLTLVLFQCVSYGQQVDTAFIAKIKALDTMDILKLDTLNVPDDGLTKKIKLLRSERTGLTAEMILKMKIGEEQGKDKKHPKEYYDNLMNEVTTGRTARLIENSIINLYRRTYTESEIDELINFYKTSAGKKMDKEYILLMVQSIKDTEQILKLTMSEMERSQKK